MSTLQKSGIYAITDCGNISGNMIIEKTEIMLKNGIALLQYRNKNKQSPDYLSLAKELQRLCQQYECPFIINDDLELTGTIDADGIHLGKDDIRINEARSELGKNKLIGFSCYNQIERAIYAEKNGANYVALGAFYPSPTKPNAVKVNLSQLQQTRDTVSLPIIAIGGITPENGKVILDSGADMLAVVSGLYQASDIEKTVHQYNTLFK